MTGDERDEEREFLSDLKARSGRDLAEWMAAISAHGFADKNETIDWLRAQGFPFARASWLERIYKNGGRPIYMDAPPAPAAGPRPPPAMPRPAPVPRAPSKREAADLDKLIAGAKGYRPLYQLLEAEIRKAVPGVAVMPKAGYISFAAPQEFAAATLHATEIRLGLALGDHPFDPPLQPAKLRGPGPAITHMAVLTDARLVSGDLVNLIQAANARVNSQAL
jgi:hypothetical protein